MEFSTLNRRGPNKLKVKVYDDSDNIGESSIVSFWVIKNTKPKAHYNINQINLQMIN